MLGVSSRLCISTLEQWSSLCTWYALCLLVDLFCGRWLDYFILRGHHFLSFSHWICMMSLVYLALHDSWSNRSPWALFLTMPPHCLCKLWNEHFFNIFLLLIPLDGGWLKASVLGYWHHIQPFSLLLLMWNFFFLDFSRWKMIEGICSWPLTPHLIAWPSLWCRLLRIYQVPTDMRSSLSSVSSFTIYHFSLFKFCPKRLSPCSCFEALLFESSLL